MASRGEMGGFIFCATYLIVFSALLSSMPVGLQGIETTVNVLFPIDPTLVTGFAYYEQWNSNSTYYTGVTGYVTYDYSLNSKDWFSASDNSTDMAIIRKEYFLGLFWLGAIDPVKFISPDGSDHGSELYFTTITADAEEGAVRYDLESVLNGESAGAFVIYWNSTAYSTASLAWDAGALWFVHGWGIDDTSATGNIASLLLSLLFFQLPNTPPLFNAIFGTSTWACVIYLVWFVIKEMIPF